MWNLRREEEVKASERQGIGSILGSEFERPKLAASLRRTLSADMSSKKSLAQYGFSSLKKIPSSEEFPVMSVADSSSSCSEGEEEEEYKEKKVIWSSIQSEEKKELEQPGELDIWSSILSQKADNLLKSSAPPAPYIHPLVKRSASSLSTKSLEICTESLGSETGSDGFSSYTQSETGDVEEEIEQEQEQEQEQQQQEEKKSQAVNKDEFGNLKYNWSASRKSPPRSFPPPLPSLSSRDGPCLHMRSHRKDGRLVLEAVPVPSHNYFHTRREGGRLLLTFINHDEEMKDEEEEEEEEFIQQKEEAEKEEQVLQESKEEEEIEKTNKEIEAEDKGLVIELQFSQPLLKLPSGLMNVHRAALVVNTKLMSMTNKSPIGPHKFDLEEEEEEEPTSLPQSLPPPLQLAAAATAGSLNAYEYGWRNKHKRPVATFIKGIIQKPLLPFNTNKKFSLAKNLKPQEQQQMMVLRGNKADYLVPLLRGCKDHPRSLLIWEPCCIATS